MQAIILVLFVFLTSSCTHTMEPPIPASPSKVSPLRAIKLASWDQRLKVHKSRLFLARPASSEIEIYHIGNLGTPESRIGGTQEIIAFAPYKQSVLSVVKRNKSLWIQATSFQNEKLWDMKIGSDGSRIFDLKADRDMWVALGRKLGPKNLDQILVGHNNSIEQSSRTELCQPTAMVGDLKDLRFVGVLPRVEGYCAGSLSPESKTTPIVVRQKMNDFPLKGIYSNDKWSVLLFRKPHKLWKMEIVSLNQGDPTTHLSIEENPVSHFIDHQGKSRIFSLVKLQKGWRLSSYSLEGKRLSQLAMDFPVAELVHFDGKRAYGIGLREEEQPFLFSLDLIAMKIHLGDHQ